MMLLLKNLLFTVLVPGAVGFYVPLLIAGRRTGASGLALWFSFILIAVGVGLYGWSIWDFARVGRGTPAPIDAPKTLVIRGPYRYVRNPMYVAVLTVIAGWAVHFQSATILLYGIAVGGAFHAFIVLYEEKHLQRVFGEAYANYLATVGRWFPKPPRTHAS